MSNNLNIKKVWIIGAGNMAHAYADVLKALDIPFIAIGRSEERAAKFEADTGITAYSGGLDAFLEKSPELPDFAINTVQAEFGAECIGKMLGYGVKKILAEKPSGFNSADIHRNADLAAEKGAKVYVAYNRRFYASTLAAKKIIEEDGGVKSFSFEFTELWRVMSQSQGDVSGWYYGNSTHVCDLAFYLGGTPKKMTCYKQEAVARGYTSSVVFAGAGVSESNAMFTYQANYLAPGRWGVEVMTANHRLIFRPMEQLQVQNLGSFSIDPVEIDDSLDKQFKPGLYMQVKTFIENPESPILLPLAQQAQNMEYYELMHNGGTMK